MATTKSPRIPSLVYGTAWKKDHTRALVRQALLAGFRGVDTAAQPKHYQEDLVGQGMRDAINEGVVKREDLYVRFRSRSMPLSCCVLMQYSDSNKVHFYSRPKPSENALRPCEEYN